MNAREAVEVAGALRLAKEALEFYADHALWERLTNSDARPAGILELDPRAMVDRGARAREAVRSIDDGCEALIAALDAVAPASEDADGCICYRHLGCPLHGGDGR